MLMWICLSVILLHIEKYKALQYWFFVDLSRKGLVALHPLLTWWTLGQSFTLSF